MRSIADQGGEFASFRRCWLDVYVPRSSLAKENGRIGVFESRLELGCAIDVLALAMQINVDDLI